MFPRTVQDLLEQVKGRPTNRQAIAQALIAGRPAYFKAGISINAELEDGGDSAPNAVRFTFDLHTSTGVTRQFIIDVPNDEAGTTDVWVNDHTVEVGDTPEDGFATYTPVKS